MTTSTTHSDGATSGITRAAIELGKHGYWVLPIKQQSNSVHHTYHRPILTTTGFQRRARTS